MNNYTAIIDNNGFKSTPKVQSSNLLKVPEIPETIYFDSNLCNRPWSWIDEYTDYAKAISPMTPSVFHESAAFWLTSVAIARRLVLRMPFGNIYPNLYVLWNAQSTLYKKSTAMEIAAGFASELFPFLLAPHDTTPEAMLSDMAGKEPSSFSNMTDAEKAMWEKERIFCAQRGWVLDEFSGLMAGMGRDYNAGLLEALLRFYDCKENFTRSTRLQGRISVRNSYLTILSASTPSALAYHLGIDRLWTNGFWPRFAILTPETDHPNWIEAVEKDSPSSLKDHLHQLFNKLPLTKWPNPPQALSVSLGNCVMDIWKKYCKAMSHDLLTPDLDSRLFASYGRFPIHVLKISILLAALDWEGNNSPSIELPHIVRAIKIAEEWRVSVHRALAQVVDDKFEQLRNRIIRFLSQDHINGKSFRDICRAMRDRRPQEITNTLQEMVSSGDVILDTKGSGPKGGRPTDNYRIANIL